MRVPRVPFLRGSRIGHEAETNRVASTTEPGERTRRGRTAFLAALLMCVAAVPPVLAQESVSPQYEVNHPPYLQLGDAPLIGFPGSETDRIEILWQTRTVGSGDADAFVVEYRARGGEWLLAGPQRTIVTGVGGREIRAVSVVGLRYDAAYEYRVSHLRADEFVDEWIGSFRTRLAPGALRSFAFAAYGDSAWRNSIRPFRDLQALLIELDPAFSLLLGDNAYNHGTHAQLDARFDPQLNPEGAAWSAGHIDYAAFGNHDVVSRSGTPTEETFASPVPVAGASAPVAPPESERPERNYSFDYGSAHFATFDTNALGDLGRLEALVDWLVADLIASDQPWKIVFGHHPVAGAPDKGRSLGAAYYRTVVPALVGAGADLFMVGDSHTFGWTYPLTGEEDGEATYADRSACPAEASGHMGCVFQAGAGVVQVISGVGGKSLRPGSFDRYPYVAAGFSSSTEPRSRVGLALVEVTPYELAVDYVAADDGSVLGSFTIRRSISELWPPLLKIG